MNYTIKVKFNPAASPEEEKSYVGHMRALRDNFGFSASLGLVIAQQNTHYNSQYWLRVDAEALAQHFYWDERKDNEGRYLHNPIEVLEVRKDPKHLVDTVALIAQDKALVDEIINNS